VKLDKADTRGIRRYNSHILWKNEQETLNYTRCNRKKSNDTERQFPQ